MPKFLTQTDVAEMLGISMHHLKRLRDEEGLPYIRVSERNIRIREDDLLKWIDNRAEGTSHG